MVHDTTASVEIEVGPASQLQRITLVPPARENFIQVKHLTGEDEERGPGEDVGRCVQPQSVRALRDTNGSDADAVASTESREQQE